MGYAGQTRKLEVYRNEETIPLTKNFPYKDFGCRPIATALQPVGPASESLQGTNPRKIGVGRAASAMGICRGRRGYR
jgi:hypothetical protein